MEELIELDEVLESLKESFGKVMYAKGISRIEKNKLLFKLDEIMTKLEEEK